MSKENNIIIAAAGSGKTTYLVNKALSIKNEKVIITTYTEANEAEIRKKIIEINKHIPNNISIQTWFSFLLQHGVRPYQGSYNDAMFAKDIKGMLLSEGQSGCRNPSSKGKKIYWGEKDFDKYYFTNNNLIFSDKLSKFVIKCNENSKGNLIDRLSRIYSYIFVDEVQDLAGYDLEILKLFFQSKSSILLVGDPRQVTYLTHHERKYAKYSEGNIKEFAQIECAKLNILVDETSLKYSHRNNSAICVFSSKLYPSLPISEPCTCSSCRLHKVEHEGIYLIKENEIDDYISHFSPTVLKWRNSIFPEWNFGKSKGLTFDRILVYPTTPITKYLLDGKLQKTKNGKLENTFDIAKFYVAVTRAKHSVAIIYNYNDNEQFIDGVQKWKQTSQ